MATASSGPQGLKSRREMQEVKAPQQIQFTKQGQSVSGFLISMEPAMVKGKQVIEYLFQREDTGERFTCLGTADLDKKLHPGLVGHFVQIRYATDDSSFQKADQNPMKVFEVKVSKEREL
jgi:hypothetical protein